MEAFKLVDDVYACDRPVFVLTGGDPLMRDDIYEIVEYGTSLNIPMSVSPSATGRLTRAAVTRLATAGVRRISLSLDAPDAQAHDAFRGVVGSFKRTVEGIGYALDCGIGVQINTTVAQHNRLRLLEFEEVLGPFGIALWSLFFVLPVGRAAEDMCLTADQTEAAFGDIYSIASRAAFDVKATEAPHYRRFAIQHSSDIRAAGRAVRLGSRERFAGIGDGRGFVFVSHHGDIQPSGFLPLPVGNVREQNLLDVYRDHPIMQRLREPHAFDGKCGACEYNVICGGSRARAYAASRNPFGSDASCEHIPAAYARHVP